MPGKLSIFKNNTDFVGNSYGCHENYLVDRDVDFYYLAEQLIPFLVTLQIYAGAGKRAHRRRAARGATGTDTSISHKSKTRAPARLDVASALGGGVVAPT